MLVVDEDKMRYSNVQKEEEEIMNSSSNSNNINMTIPKVQTIHNHKQPKDETSSTKRRLFGLQGLIAFKEALITVVASIVVFIPFGFNENSLVLVPVFCVIIANTLSTWTGVMNGTIVVLGTGVATLFCYLNFLIIPHRHWWITFITTFIFTFIIASLSVGRRWFTPLAVKKCLIDIAILMYFSPLHDKNQQLWENFVIGLMIMASITIVGMLVLPILSTRLFVDKSAKTLDSIRHFFRGVGYQMEARINSEEPAVLLVKNYSFNFPMFPETIDNQLMVLDEDNNLKEFKDNPSNLNTVDASILESIKASDTVLLPPPSSLSPQPSSLKDSNGNVARLPITRSTGMDRLGAEILTPTYSEFDETLDTPTISTGQKRKKAVLTSSIKIPGEKELHEMDNKLTNEINRLTLLLADSRAEKWNATLMPHFEQLLSLLEINHKQLLSIKLSVQHGFNPLIGKEIILPMLPLLNSMIEEIYLQIGFMVEVIRKRYSPKDSPIDSKQPDGISLSKKTRDLLQESFDETEALLTVSQEMYKQVVGEYQKSNLPTLPASEITKVHFFIFGIFSFSRQQCKITDIIYQINCNIRRYTTSFEIIQYGFPIILLALPNYFYSHAIRIGRVFSNRESSLKQIFKTSVEYFYNLFFANKKWQFPLQLSIGFTSAVIGFWYFEGRRYNEFVVHGVWACATVGLVMSPSLGATITRGIHRVIGTLCGALLGFVVGIIVDKVPTAPKIVILMLVTFVWVFNVAFIQQDVRFSYAGAVAGLTYIIVAYGSYQSFSYYIGVLRSFHIVLGVVWVVIISFFIFPYFTYRKSKVALYEITSNMCNTFIRIIENGLRVDGRQITDMEQEKLNQEKENQEIATSIRNIRMALSKQKNSLYDIRSELLLKPKTSSAPYFEMIEILSRTFTRLVATEASFHSIFSNEIILSMNPILSSLNQLLDELKKSNQDIKTLVYNMNRPYGDEDIPKVLADDFNKLDTSFQAVRHKLLRKKILFNLHPEMIQFGSGMYCIRDFIKHVCIVLRAFPKIKKDRRSKSIPQYDHQIEMKEINQDKTTTTTSTIDIPLNNDNNIKQQPTEIPSLVAPPQIEEEKRNETEK
ncbi:hypothetical protein DFA_08334 [Cavenderia fasciculata]|uniref:DUF2421 domain-containing protein n=1 Tax=Cavenderia fasciculata TaxID=261658 RepID=F4Q5T0_CACFS|nr:uncharacterized protein DFA_08334 [Cavenderia fasciculata]EGG17339.1 hypothetical protein DFA_08334 [Cavenderia fasciculata]|eukprot:XP_004355823.1 hypothetical protein DFA_08334 [Cavenderia fasciculata]